MMPKPRGYTSMNKLTERIRAKGYTLKEFLNLINKSLSTFRRYEHLDRLTTDTDIEGHKFFINKIDGLESKI